jgi:copper chaperone CopZ
MKIRALALLAILLSAGCQDFKTTSSTFNDQTSVTPATFNVAGKPTIDLSIPNMHCQSCVAKTSEVLSKQPGVVDLRVDLDTKRATLAIDEASFDPQAALAVLDDYGFADSKIVTD